DNRTHGNLARRRSARATFCRCVCFSRTPPAPEVETERSSALRQFPRADPAHARLPSEEWFFLMDEAAISDAREADRWFLRIVDGLEFRSRARGADRRRGEPNLVSHLRGQPNKDPLLY